MHNVNVHNVLEIEETPNVKGKEIPLKLFVIKN